MYFQNENVQCRKHYVNSYNKSIKVKRVPTRNEMKNELLKQ